MDLTRVTVAIPQCWHRSRRFRLSRFNRYSDFYDIGDGEWGWFDENIDEDREQFIVRDIPLTTDRWYFNVFR